MALITITRQFGAGGSEVAAGVAGRLGWRLLDNSLVDAIADQMGVSAETVRALDERQPPLITRFADTLALGASEVMTPASGAAVVSSDARLIDSTRRVLEDAVARGPVVVVGRGAQVVLSEHTDALHVFCCAPPEALARRVSERENISIVEAEHMVHEMNRQRALSVKRHYGRVWGAPENYHLCVNTEWLGIDGAATLIAGVARERFSS